MTQPRREMSEWCAEQLGARASEVLFERHQISSVTGLLLADGREIVVKARPPAERIQTCSLIQWQLWEGGFPCAQPLAGPAPLGDLVATAETYIEGGDAHPRVGAAPLFARWLARLVALAGKADGSGTLEPVPYWMNWDHGSANTWPPDPNVDLNQSGGPAWLERAGVTARARLVAATDLPSVIGHADWESQNLCWQGDVLHVAHDWDSLVRRPEAVIVGMTSLIFPSTGTANEAATIEESEEFLAAYQAERGRDFTAEELELAWAAGLWIGAWKAKKALRFGDRSVAEDLARHAPERVLRSGAAR